MKSARNAIVTVILSTTILICALPFPVPASAAPANWQEVNVSLDTTLEYWPAGKLFMNATLPENTPLPAVVEIMVPSGREITWVGELLGGPLENNPRAQYRRMPHDENFETVRAVLTQSRTLRLELFGQGLLKPADGFTEAMIGWRTSSDIPVVRLGVIVPAESAITTGPAEILADSLGDNRVIYFSEHRDVASGDTLELRLGYTNIEGPMDGTASGGGNQGILFPVVVALVLAVVTGALLIIQARTRRRRESE